MENWKNKSAQGQLGAFVGRRIEAIQNAYLSTSGHAKGARELAALRHAVTKVPGDVADTWSLEFEGMPTVLVGQGDVPSPGEWATHAALTLYAIHQQSQITPMHQRGREHGLGQAIRQLVQRDSNAYKSLEEGELPRRFAALVTAESFPEAVHYARQLVGQLRGEAIPLDYALLAQQFYDLQMPGRADTTKLAWGRGFAQYQKDDSQSQEQDASPVDD